MAANINDKITKTLQGSTYPNVARLTADRSPGAPTIQANNLAGWNEETAQFFKTFRENTATGKPTLVRDWVGIANTTTNTLSNVTWLAGAPDEGLSINDIIEAGPTTTWANALATAMLVSHDTQGNLKPAIVNTAALADASVTTAKLGPNSVTAEKIDFTTFSRPRIGVIPGATLNSTGNKAITGVGFKPSMVKFTLLPAYTNAMDMGIGAMTPTSQYGMAITTGYRTHSKDGVVLKLSGSGADQMKFSYVSMDADGFTVNVSIPLNFDVAYEAYP